MRTQTKAKKQTPSGRCSFGEDCQMAGTLSNSPYAATSLCAWHYRVSQGLCENTRADFDLWREGVRVVQPKTRENVIAYVDDNAVWQMLHGDKGQEDFRVNYVLPLLETIEDEIFKADVMSSENTVVDVFSALVEMVKQ